jgi:preprotein translocase subunit SecE
MAVAEARKMEKDGGSSGKPEWLTRAVGFLPGKFNQGKSFLAEVRAELRKVTWPSRKEVYATTAVVILTTIFFGFYLYGIDLILSQVFTRVVR